MLDVGDSHLAAAANAAENILALCKARNGWSYRHEDYVIADAGHRGCRVVVARPSAAPAAAITTMIELAGRHLPGQPLVIEDTFGTLPLEQHGFAPFDRMPVMVRPPAREEPRDLAATSIRVAPASTNEEVDAVERLMVQGLPIPTLLPWLRGVLFPPDPVEIPGWLMWLAWIDGIPAAAAATFDDGCTVGLYGMVTDPPQRRRGVGGALLAAILARFAGREMCLSATEEGFWLYARAGYATVGQAAWWRHRPD
jgi:GNAT superfamily N-acetyltransferase